MKEIILIKNGEIALKGLNRSSFEDRLIRNIRHRLDKLGRFTYTKAQSTIVVQPQEDCQPDFDKVMERLEAVFGIAALTRAAVVAKDWDAIRQGATAYLGGALGAAKTFKVEAKRSDKSFAMASPAICRELGAALLADYPHLTVDVNRPDVLVVVEIRDFGAYIHTRQVPGAGGIPVGTGGKIALLLSGGIDSPVAGYMMAKRGLEVAAVHFASPPYTSDRALHKVEKLAEIMTAYCGDIPLFVVPFTQIQEQIRAHCPEEYFTVIMRRLMMRIAGALARQEGCGGLCTGESLGQVASQTLHALACTDAVSPLPVLRPVIGMDKQEIVVLSRKIGAFETSILPYEDCCTVFTPRHPRTRPSLHGAEAAEQGLAIETLCEEAIAGTQMRLIRQNV